MHAVRVQHQLAHRQQRQQQRQLVVQGRLSRTPRCVLSPFVLQDEPSGLYAANLKHVLQSCMHSVDSCHAVLAATIALFDQTQKRKADQALADFFYGEGLPLHIVKSPYLRTFLLEAQKVKNYVPPAYNTLRTSLLDDAKQRTKQSLEPWEQRLDETGCSVCSDGWSDAASRPLLNMLAVNPKGAQFLTAINTSGEAKSAEFIAARIMEQIEDVEADKVVQVGRAAV